MPKPEVFLCRACMTTYVGEHVCESKGKAVYHITLRIEVRGEPSRLEEFGEAVVRRVKEAGLRVVHVNAKWANARECLDPNYRPPKRRASRARGARHGE